MTLDNDQIAAHAKTILGDLVKGAKLPKDIEVIEAAVALVVNLLQNINDIAYCAVNADQRADRQ